MSNDNPSDTTPLMAGQNDDVELDFQTYMFGLDSNWLGVVLAHVKELFAVITFLLCVSRVGSFDYFAMPVIYFFVLITYGMPFMNPAVWVCLRLGPYYNSKQTFRTWFTIFAILVFQFFGTLFAALIRNSLTDTFGQEVLSVSPVAMPIFLHSGGPQLMDRPWFETNGGGVNSMILISPKGTYDYNCSRFTPYPYQENVACHNESTTWGTWSVLEEIADTCFFCLGIIYLFQIVEKMNNDDRQKKIAALKQSNQPKDVYKDSGPDDTSTIPIMLATVISLLALGLNYAFPTAHHGLHITMFKIWLKVVRADNVPAELTMRLLGGFIGGLIAGLWYGARWWLVNWLNEPVRDASPFAKWGVNKNLVNNRGLLYSRMTMRKPGPGMTAVYIPRNV